MIYIFLFICSFTGWIYAIQKLTKAELCFIPAAAISLQTVIVFFGGILGTLEITAWIVLACGLVGLIRMIVDITSGSLKVSLSSVFWLCFIGAAVIFLHILPGGSLEHYDNFSHWAIAVKSVLSSNAFPGQQNQLIEFQNYPLGTTSWIYYFCYFFGHSEGIMLLAQGILIFSLFSAILGMVRKKQIFLIYGVLATVCAVLTFFNITIRINNLLVDFILPLFVLACWSIMDHYRDDARQYLLLVPLQALLLVTKSTGVIFCLFAAFGWFYQGAISWKEKKWKARFKHLVCGIISLIISFSTFAAWKVHMALNFAGVSNKFETDAGKIASGGSKTPEEIRQVVSTFIEAAADMTSRPAQGFVYINIAAVAILIVVFAVYKKPLKRLLSSLILLDLMTLAYYAGILGMYVFSMPMDEASTVAGFERYACSIIVLFAGGVGLAITAEIQNAILLNKKGLIRFNTPDDKKNYQKFVLASIMASLIILTSEYNGMMYNAESYSTSLPSKIKAVTGDRWYADGQEDKTKYLFYGTDHDGLMTSYYFHYVSRYYMYAPNLDAICDFYEDNMDNLLREYDVLAVIESDRREKRLLEKHYGVNGAVGFYKIVKNGETVSLEPYVDKQIASEEPKHEFNITNVIDDMVYYVQSVLYMKK